MDLIADGCVRRYSFALQSTLERIGMGMECLCYLRYLIYLAPDVLFNFVPIPLSFPFICLFPKTIFTIIVV